MKATLSRVVLEDVGLITKAEFEVGSGLTVFTGETGSGKTMVIDGLGFGFGERANAEIVRNGAARARVGLAFDLDEAARTFFEEAGFPLDPGELAFVEREISAGGKSQARCNGRSATAAQIRDILGRFVERVGQHDQQRLLDPREHLDIVDRYGGPKLLALRDRTAQSYAALAALERERLALVVECERGAADREDAEHALEVIDALALAPDEDRRLRERRDRLLHIEKISRSVQHAHDALSDDDSAVTQLGLAVQALREIESFDQSYAELAARLLAIQSELGDVANTLARDLSEEDVGTQELETVETRLEQIERLKRRYGGTLEGIEAARLRFREIMLSRSECERRLRQCTGHARVAAQTLDADADLLTQARKRVAARLQTAVNSELAAVAMTASRFEVQLTKLERMTASGAERLEFQLAANAASPLRPLGKVASGGELSRILLALTVVLAGDTGTSLMIFDEIDAGIGGVTASAVGERLYRLATNVQVICVTHLAQLAAFGDAHFTVEKSAKKKLPQIEVRALRKRAEVIGEVARMLSGADSEIAREHAADLLGRKMALKA